MEFHLDLFVEESFFDHYKKEFFDNLIWDHIQDFHFHIDIVVLESFLSDFDDYFENDPDRIEETVMQKYVGDKLPYFETRGKKEMQPEQFVQVYSVFGQCHGAHPAKHVDDEQIFCYGW